MGIQTLKKPWLWLCLLFAFLWRIPLLQGGIWRDEGLVLFIQRLPPSAMLSFLKLHESHPPLFYLIMRPWTLLFGEGAGLVLPFLFGLLLVVFVYRIGKTVFSEDTGIFAAALVAFSPSLVNYSTELRPYSLLSILCLLSTSFLWLALREGKSKDWGLYSATTLGMLFLHNWAWLVFAGQGLMFGLSFSKRPLSSLLRQWGASQGLVLLLYSPWFSALFFQFRHAGYPPRPLGFLFALDLLAEATFSLPLLMVVLLLAAFFLLLREEEIGERLPYLLFLGIPLVVFALAFGLSSGRGMINNALFSVLAPFFLLILADLFARFFKRRKKEASALLALLLLFYAFQTKQMLGSVRSDASEVASAVTASSRPDDLVAIAPEWLCSSFNYYFRQPNRQLTILGEGRVGALDWSDYAARLADSHFLESLEKTRREGKRVWLITEDPNTLLKGVPEKPDIARKDWGMMSSLRSRELIEGLIRLYGQPKQLPVPHLRCRREELSAFLFTPPAGKP